MNVEIITTDEEVVEKPLDLTNHLVVQRRCNVIIATLESNFGALTTKGAGIVDQLHGSLNEIFNHLPNKELWLNRNNEYISVRIDQHQNVILEFYNCYVILLLTPSTQPQYRLIHKTIKLEHIEALFTMFDMELTTMSQKSIEGNNHG